MTGGLYDPLGANRDGGGRRGPRPSAPVAAAALLLAGLTALLAVSYLRDTGDRGMPVAVAPIERPPPVPAVPAAPPAGASAVVPTAIPAAPVPPAMPAPAASAVPAAADQDVRIENGVRVVRPRREAQPPAVPFAAPATLPPGLPPVLSPAPSSGQVGHTLRAPEGGAVR